MQDRRGRRAAHPVTGLALAALDNIASAGKRGCFVMAGEELQGGTKTRTGCRCASGSRVDTTLVSPWQR